MNAIMFRSFAEHMGIKWKPDLACVEFNGPISRVVTWAEVMEVRRERQATRLARIREEAESPILPCYVWTFFNRQDIPYHGWYCYVVTRHKEIAVNFRGLKEELALSVMRAVPCGILPAKENFEQWMAAFAAQHPRRKTKDPRKAGSLVGWLVNREQFVLKLPLCSSPASAPFCPRV